MLNREEEYRALYKVTARVEKPPKTIMMPLHKYGIRDKTPYSSVCSQDCLII